MYASYALAVKCTLEAVLLVVDEVAVANDVQPLIWIKEKKIY
jgi:hypothetical protein